ncbi:MAG TPA: class I SAM-dependent methyltransferase [Polyangiaceae bacterium]|nr:class I SAM-dependent methyltransferase [Polyangiaceae bacterium]
MLREVAHFCWTVPEAAALKRAMPQADFYDLIMRRADEAGMAAQRGAAARGLTGRVLELGCGTGLMFPHYPREATVEAVDVDEEALVLASRRATDARAAGRSIRVQRASALALPFEDGGFDAVVCALVLCSVESVAAVLGELTRVARAGADVRLIEHVRSPRPVAGALMALVDPLWVALNGQGCHMSRRTEREVVDGGLALLEVEAFQVFARGLPALPMRRMRARVADATAPRGVSAARAPRGSRRPTRDRAD